MMGRAFDGMYGDYGSYIGGSSYSSTGSGKSQFFRCYEQHQPLKLGNGTFIGGNCHTPVTDDADVYIGFQSPGSLQGREPWDRGDREPVVNIQYTIQDMCAPASPKKFRKLVEWTVEQLIAGKTVHAGCIGGHGRTGTFLSAVISVMMGEPDPIGWVRKNYCEKAVESKEQIDFLIKHYGAAPAKPNKSHYVSSGSKGGKVHQLPLIPATGGKEIKAVAFRDADRVFNPMTDAKKLIWGKII